MIREEEYITFGIAPYCLAKLLLALHQQEICNFWITQCDDNLYVRIPKSHLEKIVYGVDKGFSQSNCSTCEEDVEEKQM